MKKFIELFIRFADGTGRVALVERNTPEGRRSIDRFAFEAITSDDVTSVATRPTNHRYQTTKGNAR